jgi:AcrR family transcriptional regulator
MAPGVIAYTGRVSRWEPDAAGRLIKAAIELFDEQGYDATTVAEIAERAGLTKRTFFRHFPDKREVLFQGSQELEGRWLAGIASVPAHVDPLAAVTAGFTPVAELFADRLPFARLRAAIVAANPELRERELIKLHRLADAIEGALLQRGVSQNAAILAAQTGVTIFHVAFGRWVRQDDPARLQQYLEESLEELRAVTAAGHDVAASTG